MPPFPLLHEKLSALIIQLHCANRIDRDSQSCDISTTGRKLSRRRDGNDPRRLMLLSIRKFLMPSDACLHILPKSTERKPCNFPLISRRIKFVSGGIFYGGVNFGFKCRRTSSFDNTTFNSIADYLTRRKMHLFNTRMWRIQSGFEGPVTLFATFHNAKCKIVSAPNNGDYKFSGQQINYLLFEPQRMKHVVYQEIYAKF
ncbi:hypothetical protein TcasGA2_TC014123 [Tribolium castaneum]|uniref:Uncharacterized protein n=1 Tax=Tribolium castaneum TaxID=7070 RepID=D6WKC5_TRICA|nr:hypothetical protein TcasGA2_TC014123 [Tribolium castaneum]